MILTLTSNGYVSPPGGYPFVLSYPDRQSFSCFLYSNVSSILITGHSFGLIELNVDLLTPSLYAKSDGLYSKLNTIETVPGNLTVITHNHFTAASTALFQFALDIPVLSKLAGDSVLQVGTIDSDIGSLVIGGTGTDFPTNGEWTGKQLMAPGQPWVLITRVTSSTELIINQPVATFTDSIFYVRTPAPIATVLSISIDHLSNLNSSFIIDSMVTS